MATHVKRTYNLIGDLRFSRWWLQTILSSALWCCAFW